MICERCKIREANIKYTEVINGVKKEHNLCSQCAGEIDFGQYSSIFDGEFPLGKLLSDLLGLGETSSSKHGEMYQVTCPTCRTTYEEFLKNSCFGCADCYQVFDLLIAENIKKLQGSGGHKGKVPKIRSRSEQMEVLREEKAPAPEESDRLESLKRQLAAAIKKEEYETAARLRDEIRAYKEEIKTDE